jgi:hypothetical protein
MSDALAIATVTQALALLIANNLQPEIDMAVSVETRRPPAEPPADPTITVFLYQVTPNASMRHHDLPTRSSDGTLLKRPAAPLDLHYLISAYGDEAELVGQRLIGCVVRTLHEIPVLPKELIEEAAERPYLGGSDLAESLQKVRFAPAQMDVDETSKLWGMLHQTPYSLSVVYQGSLVMIDGREKPAPAPPVRERTVRVAPFDTPGAPGPPWPGNGNGTSSDSAAGPSTGAAAPESAGANARPAGGASRRPAAGAAARAGAAAGTTGRSSRAARRGPGEPADGGSRGDASDAAAAAVPAGETPATFPAPPGRAARKAAGAAGTAGTAATGAATHRHRKETAGSAAARGASRRRGGKSAASADSGAPAKPGAPGGPGTSGEPGASAASGEQGASGTSENSGGS